MIVQRLLAFQRWGFFRSLSPFDGRLGGIEKDPGDEKRLGPTFPLLEHQIGLSQRETGRRLHPPDGLAFVFFAVCFCLRGAIVFDDLDSQPSWLDCALASAGGAALPLPAVPPRCGLARRPAATCTPAAAHLVLTPAERAKLSACSPRLLASIERACASIARGPCAALLNSVGASARVLSPATRTDKVRVCGVARSGQVASAKRSPGGADGGRGLIVSRSGK